MELYQLVLRVVRTPKALRTVFCLWELQDEAQAEALEAEVGRGVEPVRHAATPRVA